MTRLRYLAAAAAFATVLSTSAFAANTPAQDKKFVAAAGEGSLFEVEAARLALKSSENPDVRAFAERMIKDHNMLIDNMKPFADKMGVPGPTQDKLSHSEKVEYRRLSSKRLDAFDKDYISTMVDDHHADLADFNKESNTTANMDLKATVNTGIEVIKGHTEMIEGIAKKYNVVVKK